MIDPYFPAAHAEQEIDPAEAYWPTVQSPEHWAVVRLDVAPNLPGLQREHETADESEK